MWCSRKLRLIALSAIPFAPLIVVTEAALAQGNPPCEDVCWINVKTGMSVPTAPRSAVNLVAGSGGAALAGRAQFDGLDPNANRATNTKTGQTYIRQPDGSWIDAKTGICVPTAPRSAVNLVAGSGGAALAGRAQFDGLDPSANRATNTKTGETFIRVPCPPPQATASSGLYLGGELVKNWGRVRSTERFAATDVVTNQFTDSADPFGVGVLLGYKFVPWGNVVVSPFVSFDYLNAPVNHNFPGGSLLGTTPMSTAPSASKSARNSRWCGSTASPASACSTRRCG